MRGRRDSGGDGLLHGALDAQAFPQPEVGSADGRRRGTRSGISNRVGGDGLPGRLPRGLRDRGLFAGRLPVRRLADTGRGRGAAGHPDRRRARLSDLSRGSQAQPLPVLPDHRRGVGLRRCRPGDEHVPSCLRGRLARCRSAARRLAHGHRPAGHRPGVAAHGRARNPLVDAGHRGGRLFPVSDPHARRRSLAGEAGPRRTPTRSGPGRNGSRGPGARGRPVPVRAGDSDGIGRRPADEVLHRRNRPDHRGAQPDDGGDGHRQGSPGGEPKQCPADRSGIGRCFAPAVGVDHPRRRLARAVHGLDRRRSGDCGRRTADHLDPEAGCGAEQRPAPGRAVDQRELGRIRHGELHRHHHARPDHRSGDRDRRRSQGRHRPLAGREKRCRTNLPDRFGGHHPVRGDRPVDLGSARCGGTHHLDSRRSRGTR